ncbi:hypothetical protein MCG98_05365 [Ruminococcus sp. OA3]|uniref:hypothetical protein n=1 Tax=Ruminococcus sp. OA3 TaxID=2914164 RepID=UPI001F06BCB3|nr:hypothetical protein [Ruminococcus sp. OA3]MCH1981990.1 hypothetical protein [Ruminococcus sp. OA3]
MIEENRTLLGRIYVVAVAILISFWCVVAAGSIKLRQLAGKLEETQVQLEDVMETVQGIEVDSLNETIRTLNKIIDPLRKLMGE